VLDTVTIAEPEKYRPFTAGILVAEAKRRVSRNVEFS
jgi:hypothetical protein